YQLLRVWSAAPGSISNRGRIPFRARTVPLLCFRAANTAGARRGRWLVPRWYSSAILPAVVSCKQEVAMAGVKFVVIYSRLTDVEVFEKLYREEHIPMALKNWSDQDRRNKDSGLSAG